MRQLLFLAVCVLVSQVAQGTFPVAITAAGSTLLSLGATEVSILAYGLAIVKGIALGKFFSQRQVPQRGKRSVEITEVLHENGLERTFELLRDIEPQACYRRLICHMAAKGVPSALSNLFPNDLESVDVGRPMYDFTLAKSRGNIFKSTPMCEVNYNCQYNSLQLEEIYNQQ